MFGFMIIEIESFNESKQTSGYGVLLQKDLKEVRFACNVVVEEASVCESMIGKRRRNKNLRDMEEAMEMEWNVHEKYDQTKDKT